MGEAKLKNVATLIIAEYEDRSGIYVKIKFDPLQADQLLTDTELPDSFKLMHYVFNTSLADLAKDSMVPASTPLVPSSGTVQ